MRLFVKVDRDVLQRLTSNFGITLLIANSSAVILPFKALADEAPETLYPQRLDMPLLFAIAMVGATVGGKFF